MRTLICMLLLMLLPPMAFAQTVTNVTARQVGNTVEVTYSLDQTASVSLLLSADGGRTYNLHPKSVTGDIGSVTAGNNKKAVWNLLADSTDWDIAQARFKVVAQKVAAQRTFTVGGVSFTMVRVDGGTFTMGCTAKQDEVCRDSDTPSHQVTVTTYYIGQTEVTQKLWKTVMGTSVKQMAKGSIVDYKIYGTGDNYPMYYLSWHDCREFVGKLNLLLSQHLGKMFFSLPTEAQWEFAARGGNKSQHYKYSGSNYIDKVAWCHANSGNTTHPVASKSPNELGLYDMSGNVCEWCLDKSGKYSHDSQINPEGESSTDCRNARGGCIGSLDSQCCVWYRFGFLPEYRRSSFGLRLVLLQP